MTGESGEGPGVAAMRRQAAACGALGSPLYAALIARAADDLAAGGVVADVLGDRADAPEGDAVALRLFGGLHRLVLERRAGKLAVFYPSVGGHLDTAARAQVDAAWAAAAATLAATRAELAAGLAQPPQTNEVGRSAVLAGALRHLVATRDLPVRLAETGASAGLNLRPDLVRVTARPGAPPADTWGPADSPVSLAGGWAGPAPGAGAVVRVVARAGCDLAPLDPGSSRDRLTLTGWAWPDQTDRLERLRGAFALAATVPVRVERASAAAWVGGLAPVRGAWTVLWHSVFWQYLPATEAAATRAALDALGAAATPDAPVAEVAMEPAATEPLTAGGGFAATVTTWRGGDLSTAEIGRSPGHGLPVSWD